MEQKTKIKIEELNIEVQDVFEYESEADELLTAFCEELESQGETKSIEDSEEFWWAKEEGWSFVWSDKASSLIRKRVDELYSIGIKYFGREAPLNITSYMYREP